jgi:rare lipoprotein A
MNITYFTVFKQSCVEFCPAGCVLMVNSSAGQPKYFNGYDRSYRGECLQEKIMPYKVKSRIEIWRAGIAGGLAATILLSSGIVTAGDYNRIGEASWYGKRYHGRTTANGERFDMNALTAAHRRLPFGTLVRVTNLSNKRSLVVRINDRGPYAGGRIIDLSRRAASILGFQRLGVARVRVQTVRTAQRKQRKFRKQRNRRDHRVHSEASIRESLVRSRVYQPITLRPPDGAYR